MRTGNKSKQTIVSAGVTGKDLGSGLKKLLSYLSPYKITIIFALILAAVSTVFTIVGPKIMAGATDELVRGVTGMRSGGGVGIDFTVIGKVLLQLMGIYVVGAAFNYLQSYFMVGVSSKVSFDLRKAIMQKINKLPISYFHRTSHGDVLSRITNDVDTLSQSLNQSLTQIITSVALVIGILAMMLSISPTLTLVVVIILPIAIFLMTFVLKRSQKHFNGQQKYLGAVNGQVEEIYGGHVVVKAFNGEKKALMAFDKENDKLYESGWKAQFLSSVMQPLMTFVGNLGYVLVCIIGGVLAASGKITIGSIQAFIQYVQSFMQPVTQVAGITSQLQMMIAASDRIFTFLGERDESYDAPSISTDTLQANGDVRFFNVNFGYEDSDKTILNNFSVDVKAGQKIAIVGPTGAGKSTMVNLLMRFHETKSGAIFLDGHNITHFDRRDLRNEFAMVLQDTWLFNGTILENIRYGNRSTTDEEVISAAKAAQADHFIRTLPDGYNTVLNEESTNISQGQKQLLTIARAILADAKVMILDEATSSVDTRTEVLIQKAMDALMLGRTSFVIAHRLSTIKNADIILVMNDGDVIEQGNHAELITQAGFYANLYNSQFANAE